MAEENSHSDILSEENGTQDASSHVVGVAELSLSPQKEDDGKGIIIMLSTTFIA